METKELIKYIYETDLENTVFEDDNQKGDRALILLSKYGENLTGELKKKFVEKVNFNNITPLTAIKINEMISNYLETTGGKEFKKTVAMELDFINFKKILIN